MTDRRAAQPATRFGVPAAILALALGGFGIGATEFAIMGVLPEITRDLLSAEYAVHPELALGNASWLISAYALGVIVGAPITISVTAKLREKTALLLFVSLFATATIATALAPNFITAVIWRFCAALPHGAYFGIAPLIAGKLMEPQRRGAGVAYVLMGLTVCNLAGVPLFTALGQTAGWRPTYLVIAAVFITAAVAIWLTVPQLPPQDTLTLSNQWHALCVPKLWAVAGMAALSMAGFFTLYSYISPLVTQLAAMPLATVPLVISAAGLGMTIGTYVGGILADKNYVHSLQYALLGFFASLCATAALAHMPALLVFGIFCASIASSAMVAPTQLWLMDIAHKAPVLGGALVHAAFNAANAIGAAGAGAVIALGLGFRAPPVFGMCTCLLGYIAYLLLSRRHKQQAV